ncbi:MAG: hypothetical protein KAH84_01845 [Thiomargarita sp.]|nr:hypothetical protein [Thiomargarita sp.]
MFSYILLAALNYNVINVAENYIQEPQNVKHDSRRRGIGEVQESPPNIWAIDITNEASLNTLFCYVPSEQVSLWVPAKKRETNVNFAIFTTRKPKQRANLVFPANNIEPNIETEATIKWPKKIIIQENVRYFIESDLLLDWKMISFRQIPAEHETLAQQVEWMQEAGCNNPIEILEEPEIDENLDIDENT